MLPVLYWSLSEVQNISGTPSTAIDRGSKPAGNISLIHPIREAYVPAANNLSDL